MATMREPDGPAIPYRPPEKLLVLCRVCEGALVLYKVWKDGRMVDIEEGVLYPGSPAAPVTPVRGDPHVCAAARPGTARAVPDEGEG